MAQVGLKKKKKQKKKVTRGAGSRTCISRLEHLWFN